MAPPRRVRDEMLVLRGRGASGRDRELSRTHQEEPWFEDALPTQRRFQVSPDARALAYARPHEREVRVLRRDGAEIAIPGVRDHDLRFSPDGRRLAVVTSELGTKPVVRVDLQRLAVEPWGTLLDPSWIEFCREGLIVQHAGDGRSGHALTLLPWQGEPRRIAEARWIGRFVAAKAGTRVVYFAEEEAWAVDVASDGAPRRLGRTHGTIRNAEMSPDGQHVACATDAQLLLLRGDGAPEVADARPLIHTVWFSRDGKELAWANRSAAVWTRGSERRELMAPGGDLEAMRFIQAGAGLIVSRGREVIVWTPEQERAEPIAAADEEHALLGADLFAGGLLLWTGTPWRGTGRATKG
jgi:dipeptidyl aminopeptidase/acylaminoacyl peptidase